MKDIPFAPLHQSMFIRNLGITTNLLLHQDFVAGPRRFASRHNVDLADEVFHETDFRRDPTAARGCERIEITGSNIHLVRHGAIRLLTQAQSDRDGTRVCSIDMNPSMLLYGTKCYVLAAGDLPSSLSILREQVLPLLANPHDVRHIVPGLAQDGEEPVAYWNRVDSEFLFPRIDIRCLHGLSHPCTGPADGATPKRIQFGDMEDECVIRIKEARWDMNSPNGVERVRGIRVRLILKGQALIDEFSQFGKFSSVNNAVRMVAFSEPSLALVHQAVMARMEGVYLPVPPEWQDKADGKRVTAAKVMALVSQLTSIPLDELRTMDENIRHPSDSTRKRLKKDLTMESGRLTPVPVSTLFNPAAYSIHSSGGQHAADNIDPIIANAYSQAADALFRGE